MSAGANEDLGDGDLESAVGDDTLDELARRTGLSRAEVVNRLKTALPETINRLTPGGRLPGRIRGQPSDLIFPRKGLRFGRRPRRPNALRASRPDLTPAAPDYRTRIPAAASQCSGLSIFGSGASAGEIVTPCGQSGGQIAT